MVPKGESNHSSMSKSSKMTGLKIMAAEKSSSSNMADFLKINTSLYANDLLFIEHNDRK